MDRPIDAIEWLTDRALEAIARGDAIDPCALTLLLRRYVATETAALGDAIGLALARALEPADPNGRDAAHGDAEWLLLFVEAAAVSDDARVQDAVADLVSRIRGAWRRVKEVDQLAWSIDACLVASDVFDPRQLVPAAVDELERVVSAAYRPGEGVAHDVDRPDGARGQLGDQVRTASALLTAYASTGRLPYAMLAEELVQFARRALWAGDGGGFFDRASTDEPPAGREKPFVLNCEAARVLCRLAALHDAKEYSDVAVLAPDADYRRDAERTLDAVAPRYRDRGVAGAIYAVALGECLMR
jgi:hypothetical protein